MGKKSTSNSMPLSSRSRIKMQLPPAHIILMAFGRHHSICDLIETSLPSENKVIVHKLRSELFLWNRNWDFGWFFGEHLKQTFGPSYLINNPKMFNGAIFDLAEKPYIPQKFLLQCICCKCLAGCNRRSYFWPQRSWRLLEAKNIMKEFIYWKEYFMKVSQHPQKPHGNSNQIWATTSGKKDTATSKVTLCT